MAILGIHHLQITAPKDCESAARAFYGDLLGLEELPKPEDLRGRGGVWFHTSTADIHVGVKPDDTPPGAYRHFALRVTDATALRQKMVEVGVRLEEAPEVEGWVRFFAYDPFGNKVELLEII